MTSVTVLVPVLDRPHRVAPLLDSLQESVAVEENATVEVLFLASPGDEREHEELRRCGAPFNIMAWPAGNGDYARKINHGARVTSTEWLFTAADDLKFHPGWLRACIKEHVATGALVIGTNDLHNKSVTSGKYATHLLVHRSYLDRAVKDSPGDLFCEQYSHNCVDTELVETAKFNRTFAMARSAHVEHLHPVFRGAPDDETYRKGREGHVGDRQLLQRRRRLWSAGAKRRVAVVATSRPVQVGKPTKKPVITKARVTPRRPYRAP